MPPVTFINNPSSSSGMAFLGGKEDPNLKMRLVAFSAATKALELRKKNPGASDNDILKLISIEVDKIIREAH